MIGWECTEANGGGEGASPASHLPLSHFAVYILNNMQTVITLIP